MPKYYIPSMYLKDIYQIPVKTLKQKGVKALVFDLDNTIARTDEKIPNSKVINYFETLKKDFTLFILSKPNTQNMKRLLKENNLNKEDIILIGDQYMTDMLLAKKLKLNTILVDPISNNEFKITSINRFLEKKILKKLKEEKLLEKGKYYYE